MRRQAFWLKENLMGCFVGKPVDFVFDRGAVAGAHTLDDTRKHRASVERCTNDVVRLLVGVRNPARQLLWMKRSRAHHGKHWNGIHVSRLLCHDGKINATAINSWRRTRF